MTLSFQFGTVGSPLATPKKPGGSVGAIEFSRSIGLDTLELGWVQSVRVTEATCALIKAQTLEQKVSLSVHAPYFINLNGTEEEWPNLAGATDIVFHPGSYFGNDPAAVLKVAIPRLKECVKELRKTKNLVTLRPETMGKSAMLGSFEDTLEMSTAIKGVQPCLDFAHLHARPGDGTMNTVKEWTRILEAYQASLGLEALKSLHIHLSGIEYGPKGEKNHLALDKSDLKLKFLLQVLKDFGCGGRILCESPIMEEDALILKKTWMKISREKE
jgi:deoxyribonuclease-4